MFKSIVDYLEPLLDRELFGIKLMTPVVFVIKVAIIILIIQAIVFVIRTLLNPKRFANGRRKMDATSAQFLRNFLITVAYLLGIASVMYLIPPLRTLGTSLLAGAGIMAMAIGLASQELLSNFVGGIFIVIAKPFRIGDYVQLDSGVTGTVTEITLRHTIITTSENRKVIIPNSKINSSIITNSTIVDPKTCAFIEVGVAYTEDLDRCMAELRKLIEADPRVIDNRKPQEKDAGIDKVIVRVIELSDSAVQLRAYAWTRSNSDAFTLKCDMLKQIKTHFDAIGIEIPYPYMNVVRK